MMFPKPKRIKDPEAIERARKDYCQVCWLRYGLSVHHIKSRGSGGGDTSDNLITLCRKCHDRAHSARLSKGRLREIKSREGQP